MKVSEIIFFLESLAHPSLQENYDNAGLITGDPSWECHGIICSLDATEEVVEEAISKKCNLIVAHHPIIFSGLKKINGKNYVEKTIIRAIKNDVCIYAIHTNIDNVITGVSGQMANLLGLENISVLAHREHTLKKLYTFVPVENAEELRQAIFSAGGGVIGQYSECSFNTEGTGTYKAGDNTNPYAGNPGEPHQEKETRLEIVFPSWLEHKIVSALKASHPYEEVAYDLVSLANSHPGIGAGAVGTLPEPLTETDFLAKLKEVFKLKLVRHTGLLDRPVTRVALCGGAGSFLISKALNAGVQFFITGDMKYHEFFDANKRMVIADIGHYESEQFTINLLHGVLEQKFLTFAVLKTEVQTNPVHYFF